MKRLNVNWKSFDFGPEQLPEVKLDSKLQLTNENPNISNQKNSNTEIVTSKLTPKTVDELAVHSKKIEEIEKWLLNILNQEIKNPFLLLSGPTGSAKTTTLHVLCKKLSISVSEWINPTDKDYELLKASNQMKRFMEFLTDAKWNSLFEKENTRKITLVKDFPNAIMYQPGEFLSVLNECYKYKYPVVFICTDTKNSYINTTRTLFTEDVINEYNVSHVSFNTCAPSLMTKALKRTQSILQENFDMYRQPLPSTVDVILATAMGDIRNAINQFYLESILETDVPLAPFGNISKRKKKNETAFRSMARDESLGLFHGIGRILNPKRKLLSKSWRLNCDVEKIVAEFSIQPTLFITFLFENYLKYFGHINDAKNAAELLSFSLNFLDNWVDKQNIRIFGLWISILGLMIYNQHKVSKWNQIRAPARINNFHENSREAIGLKPVDYYYYNVIKNTNIFHTFENKI